MIKFLYFIKTIFKRLGEDNVGAFAAQAAFFIILSFAPFAILLLSLIKYLPIAEADLLIWGKEFLPSSMQNEFYSITKELFSKSITTVSVTLIIAIWSAGRGIQAIAAGCNEIFDVEETRNFIVLRIRAVFFTAIFLVVIAALLIFMVFGNNIFELVKKYLPIFAVIMEKVLQIRVIFVLAIMIVVFTFMYKFFPNRKSGILWQLPGAVFTSVGWLVFSGGFSVYINYFSKMTYMYGSMKTLIIAMMWLYFCMYIFMIGAEINSFIEQINR